MDIYNLYTPLYPSCHVVCRISFMSGFKQLLEIYIYIYIVLLKPVVFLTPPFQWMIDLSIAFRWSRLWLFCLTLTDRVIPIQFSITVPETNIFAPENGWLEYEKVSEIGALNGLFPGALKLLVSGRVIARIPIDPQFLGEGVPKKVNQEFGP